MIAILSSSAWDSLFRRDLYCRSSGAPGDQHLLCAADAGDLRSDLDAIKPLNISFLVPLALGALAGIYLTAGILEREMKKHPQFTYMLIIGFMLGSLLEVAPGFPQGAEILICMGTFSAGLFGIYILSKQKRRGAIEVESRVIKESDKQ